MVVAYFSLFAAKQRAELQHDSDIRSEVRLFVMRINIMQMLGFISHRQSCKAIINSL